MLISRVIAPSFFCSNFPYWQLGHFTTKFSISIYIRLHQNIFHGSWYIFVEATSIEWTVPSSWRNIGSLSLFFLTPFTIDDSYQLRIFTQLCVIHIRQTSKRESINYFLVFSFLSHHVLQYQKMSSKSIISGRWGVYVSMSKT